MNTESLVAKGVKKHFTGQEVLFDVASLEEHYDGLKYHDSDVIYLEDGELVVGYIKSIDVDGENATENEVIIQEDVNQIEVIIDQETLNENPELSEIGVKVGDVVLVDAENYLAPEEAIAPEAVELPQEKKVSKSKAKK